jgi:hypothetical protein
MRAVIIANPKAAGAAGFGLGASHYRPGDAAEAVAARARAARAARV